MNETVKTKTINTSAAEKKKNKKKKKKKKKRFKEMNELKERTWEHRRMRRIKESDALVQEVP